MVAWSDLEYWRSSYLDESANAGGDGRRRTRTQVEELAGYFDRFRSEGQAADAMRSAGSALQDDLDHLVQMASEYMLACEEAADGVRRVEAKTRSAQEISAEIGYPIKEDGSLDPFVPEYQDNKPVPGLQVPPMNSQSHASVVKQAKYTGSAQYKSFSLDPAANHSTYFDAPAPGRRNEALDDICRVIAGAK